MRSTRSKRNTSRQATKVFSPLQRIFVFDLDETIMKSDKMLRELRNRFGDPAQLSKYEIQPVVKILELLAELRRKGKIDVILLLTNNQDVNYVMNIDSHLLRKFGEEYKSIYADKLESLKSYKQSFFFDNIHWLGSKQRPLNKSTQYKKIEDVRAMLSEIQYNKYKNMEVQNESTISDPLKDHIVFFDDNTMHPLHEDLSPFQAFSKFFGADSDLVKFRKRLETILRSPSRRGTQARRSNKNWRR